MNLEDTIMKGLIALMAVIVFILLPLAIYGDMKREEEMLVKCKPDPSLYECQLYIGKKSSQVIPTPIIMPMNVGN
jgi:hypothetical protein